LKEQVKKKFSLEPGNVGGAPLIGKSRAREETGDALPCPLVDPYREGGLLVKLVKHEGKFMVAAGVAEHGGLVEEYYVAEVEAL